MTLDFKDPYESVPRREVHGHRYESQLRRKVSDAAAQYKALGGTRIEIAARAILPTTKIELKQAAALLETGKALAKIDGTIDLVALKARVAKLRDLAQGLRDILTQPKRSTLTTHSYYATIATRVLDFDGSDPSARQFGGTIVSRNARIDVPESAADRDPNFNAKRESHTSDTTDEIAYLQARLSWYRERIKRCNTTGSVEQFLLLEESESRDESVKGQQYIACGYGLESGPIARVNGWNVDSKCRK